MRKRLFTVSLIIAISASMFMSSCIGSFKLFNKLRTWNEGVGNKFVNELVFVAFWILPVYEVAGLADILVLNSIEFWSGTNPVAKGTRIIEGNDGRYFVKCDGKGYTIKSENDGSIVRLDFDVPTQTWSYRDAEGESHPFLTFVDDTHVALPGIDGKQQIVELSQAGFYAYKAEAMQLMLAAN